MVIGQSSKLGVTEENVLLDALLLTVLSLSQLIPTETKGSGNEKAVDSNADQNIEIGHKETNSSPAGKKRGAEFQAEDVYHRLQNKGFKIYRIGKLVFGAGDREEDNEEEEDQDTPG